jgi:hypothetical protein
MLNIDMLGANMVLGIVRKYDASLFVYQDGNGTELLVQAIQNLTEKEAKANCVLCSLSECHILSFGGGQSHGCLFLASTGDWRLTSLKDVSTSAMAQIKTTCSVTVTVTINHCIPLDLCIAELGQRCGAGLGNDFECRTPHEVQLQVCRSFNLPEDVMVVCKLIDAGSAG